MPQGHIALGIGLFESGKLDDAIVSYHRAIKLDSKSLSAHINLGEAHLENNDASNAVAAFTCALGLERNCVNALRGLGIAYYELGNQQSSTTKKLFFLRKSLEISERVKKLDPLKKGTPSRGEHILTLPPFTI
jgi:tetratricopeptide (TPR) repeat protein